MPRSYFFFNTMNENENMQRIGSFINWISNEPVLTLPKTKNYQNKEIIINVTYHCPKTQPSYPCIVFAVPLEVCLSSAMPPHTLRELQDQPRSYYHKGEKNHHNISGRCISLWQEVSVYKNDLCVTLCAKTVRKIKIYFWRITRNFCVMC